MSSKSEKIAALELRLASLENDFADRAEEYIKNNRLPRVKLRSTSFNGTPALSALPVLPSKKIMMVTRTEFDLLPTVKLFRTHGRTRLDERAAFVRFWINGISQQEIATKFAVTQGTVSNHCRKAAGL